MREVAGMEVYHTEMTIFYEATDNLVGVFSTPELAMSACQSIADKWADREGKPHKELEWTGSHGSWRSSDYLRGCRFEIDEITLDEIV